MKILVLGAGAVGMLCGGFLAKNNHRVALLGRAANMSAVNACGLCIKGIWGDHRVHNVEGYTDLPKLREKEGIKDGFDLALITVKAYDIENILQMLTNLFPAPFPVVFFQGGLGTIERAVGALGNDKVIFGSVGFAAENVAPGAVTVHACNAKVRIGGIENGIAHASAAQVADLLSAAGIPTLPSFEIERIIWNDALFGCALYGLAAVLEVDYGFLGAHEAARELVNALVREFFAVLEKENKEVDWPDSETYLRDLFQQLIPACQERYGPAVRDLQAEKRTEIDVFNGAIVNRAHAYGLDAPLNWLIRHLVKAKEKIARGGKGP